MVKVSFALWLPKFWKCALAWGLFWRKFRAPGKGAEGKRQQEQEQRTSQQEKSPGKGARKGNRKGNRRGNRRGTRRTERCKNAFSSSWGQAGAHSIARAFRAAGKTHQGSRAGERRVCYPKGCAAPGDVPCQCNTRRPLSKLEETIPQDKLV